jgi:hypothetical protein
MSVTAIEAVALGDSSIRITTIIWKRTLDGIL